MFSSKIKNGTIRFIKKNHIAKITKETTITSKGSSKVNKQLYLKYVRVYLNL